MPGRPMRFLVSSGPGLVELRYTQLAAGEKLLRAERLPRPVREVTELSWRSRRNLMKAALRFPWDELGPVALVTLTYPEEFPLDGREVKRHARALWVRWERCWGQRPRGMWCLEFQARGAPHFHAFLELPASLPAVAPVRGLMDWGFRVWSEVVGTFPDESWSTCRMGPRERMHRENGLRFNVSEAWYAESLRGDEVASYLWRHAGKWGQKRVPVGFEHPGRLWGTLGAVRRPPEVELCCERSYVMVRRAVRRLAEGTLRRSLRGGNFGGLGGVWARCADGDAVRARLVAWAQAECGCAAV